MSRIHNHASEGFSSKNRLPLRGTTRQPRPSFEAIRPADPNKTLRVVIKVRPQNELPDPVILGSMLPTERPAPQTYTEHCAVYGSDQSDIDKVVQFALDHHLDVVEASAARRMVILHGTIKNMNMAFETDLQIYQSKRTGTDYLGRVGNVHVPEELSEVVTAVVGLDNRCMVRMRPKASEAHVPQTYFLPSELAQLYNFPSQLDGSGQCVGILEFGGGFDTTDLETYFNKLNQAMPNVIAISVDGTQNSPNDPDIPISLH